MECNFNNGKTLYPGRVMYTRDQRLIILFHTLEAISNLKNLSTITRWKYLSNLLIMFIMLNQILRDSIEIILRISNRFKISLMWAWVKKINITPVSQATILIYLLNRSKLNTKWWIFIFLKRTWRPNFSCSCPNLISNNKSLCKITFSSSTCNLLTFHSINPPWIITIQQTRQNPIIRVPQS